MSIKFFYLNLLILISVFFFIALLFIWKGTKQPKCLDESNLSNKAPLYISLVFFSWFLVGAYKLLDNDIIPSLIHAFNDRLLSALSNYFILLTLPYFPKFYSSTYIEKLLVDNRQKWFYGITSIFFGIIVVFTIIDRINTSYFGNVIIVIIDLTISLITIISISYALYNAIKKFWNNLHLNYFVGISLIIFCLTQLLLPSALLFPNFFKNAYPYLLIATLFSITSFGTFNILYFSLLYFRKGSDSQMNLGFDQKEIAAQEFKVLNQISIGYDQQLSKYYIRIAYEDPTSHETIKETQYFNKILKPYSHWVAFSIANKLNVKLNQEDIASIKFRMIELWNKKAKNKLKQDDLFNNDTGLFSFKTEPDQVEINDLDFFSTKFSIRDAVFSFNKSFEKFLKSSSTKKSNRDELIIELINLMNKTD